MPCYWSIVDILVVPRILGRVDRTKIEAASATVGKGGGEEGIGKLGLYRVEEGVCSVVGVVRG